MQLTQMLKLIQQESRKYENYKPVEIKDLNDFIEKKTPKWKSKKLTKFKLESGPEIISYVFRAARNQIVAIVNVQMIKYPANSTWINQLLIYPLMDPEFMEENPMWLANFVNFGELNHLIEDHCQNQNIDISSIGFAMMILPQRHFCRASIESIINPNWKIHLNLADHVILNSNSDLRKFGSSYHIIWKNKDFDGDLQMSPVLKTKMGCSLDLLEKYEKNLNPFMNLEMRESFQKLLDMRNFYQNLPKLQTKLKRYKLLRKIIWLKFFLFNQSRYASSLYKVCFKQNFNIFEKMGLRIRAFKTSSMRGRKIVQDYQYSILMCLFDCINSEGSSFSELFDDNGGVKQEVFLLNVLESFLGDYYGLLELNIAPKGEAPEWIFVGLSFVKHRAYDPKILSSTLLFPKRFRGYGLGQILAMLAMLLCETAEIGEKFEVFGTSRNIMTNRLVEKIGFFRYGFLPQMTYGISGHDSKLGYVMGMNRTFRLSSSVLDQLYVENFNEKLKKQICKSYKLNKKLIEYFKMDLIATKRIAPIVL